MPPAYSPSRKRKPGKPRGTLLPPATPPRPEVGGRRSEVSGQWSVVRSSPENPREIAPLAGEGTRPARRRGENHAAFFHRSLRPTRPPKRRLPRIPQPIGGTPTDLLPAHAPLPGSANLSRAVRPRSHERCYGKTTSSPPLQGGRPGGLLKCGEGEWGAGVVGARSSGEGPMPRGEGRREGLGRSIEGAGISGGGSGRKVLKCGEGEGGAGVVGARSSGEGPMPRVSMDT